jgi:D-tyrosyl-tRNA(Tyr) deacylase
MIGLIQRVSRAEVLVADESIGAIGVGLLLLLGIQKQDNLKAADKLLDKILAFRVFGDDQGQMNLSLKDVNGGLLIVSQFTLAADTRKGLRPSFSSAAPPDQAEQLYNYFVESGKQLHRKVETGIFAADMKVHLVNDGPVTFLLAQ